MAFLSAVENTSMPAQGERTAAASLRYPPVKNTASSTLIRLLDTGLIDKIHETFSRFQTVGCPGHCLTHLCAHDVKSFKIYPPHLLACCIVRSSHLADGESSHSLKDPPACS